MKYVMLLRGVNVGGNRKVSMPQVRALFTSLGFSDVATYINSGNIIFSSENMPSVSNLARELLQEFGFEIPFLLLTAQDIIAIAEAIPKEWQNNNTDHKSDVIYLYDAVNSADAISMIGYRPEFETLLYVNHAVLSYLPRVHRSRSSLLKLMGTPLYKQVTIRNITTARKLAEMVR